MEIDFNPEVSGDGLYGAGHLPICSSEIVVFYNSVRPAAVGALNGKQLGACASRSKAFEDETVRIAVATI
jgi:hypothetical protein